MINFEAFTERAAILEYCAGYSRFEAETRAAQAQGATRYDAIRMGNIKQASNHREAPERQPAHDMPRVQPHAQEEKRPMPQRYIHA